MNAFQNVQSPPKKALSIRSPKNLGQGSLSPCSSSQHFSPHLLPETSPTQGMGFPFFPTGSLSLQTCPVLSWSSDPLLVTCPFSLLFLSLSPALSSHGLVQCGAFQMPLATFHLVSTTKLFSVTPRSHHVLISIHQGQIACKSWRCYIKHLPKGGKLSVSTAVGHPSTTPQRLCFPGAFVHIPGYGLCSSVWFPGVKQ